MHFDNIQIKNEATYEVDIGNIFRYRSALFKKYIGTQTEV